MASCGSLSVLLAALSCGTVDPADSKSVAGAAGKAGDGSGGNVTHAGSGGSGGSGGTPTVPPGSGGNSAGDGGGGVPDPGVDPALLPWKVGNSWTYRITKDGKVSEKTTVVGDEEMVGGVGPNAEVLANHVTTNKGANDHTESWQGPSAAEPGRIVRYREQAFSASTGMLSTETHYEPEKLHIDGSPAHMVAGVSWVEEYAETALVPNMPASTHDVSERWTVVADDETLMVPAGTFDGVVHLRKVGSSTKDYWYVRGVGKLKETGTQTEELSAYTVAP